MKAPSFGCCSLLVPVIYSSVMTCNIFSKATKTVIGIHANKLKFWLVFKHSISINILCMFSWVFYFCFLKKSDALTSLLQVLYFKCKRMNVTHKCWEGEVGYSIVFYYTNYSYLIGHILGLSMITQNWKELCYYKPFLQNRINRSGGEGVSEEKSLRR